MKANELRSGSIISINGEFSVVDHIHSHEDSVTVKDGFVIVFKGGDLETEDRDIIKPIHLTPEILEKCGFEKHHADFFIDALMLKPKGNLFEVWLYPTPPPQSAYNATNIIYLHQLQNLYFALTGEELEVKL